MLLASTLPATLLGFISLTLAQTTTTTGATPEQSSAFFSAITEYYSSYEHSPAYSSLGLNLILNLPASIVQSLESDPGALIPIPTASLDLYSLATNPPLTFATEAWQTALATGVEDEVRAAQTSAILQIAGLAQSAVSVTARISVPTGTASVAGNGAARETRVRGAVGAAAVAIGAAAVLL